MISWEVLKSDGGFPVTEYKLYVDNNLLVQLDPSLNYYKLSGLVLGSTYKLQVSAVNEIGEGLISRANSVLFANVPTAPDSLTLSANINPATIDISWTAPLTSNGDSVWGYRVYLDNGKGGPFVKVFDGVGFSSLYFYRAGIDSPLECGFLYNV